MAKQKYTKNSRGEFATRIWDGTYNADGSKHRINLKSRKSSADLEKQVNALKESIKQGKYVQPSDELFCDYAKKWLATKKSAREKNTRTMYENVINVHLAFLAEIRVSDIRNSHFQLAINNALDKPRTCQQIYITFRQIIRMAITDHLIGAGMAEEIFRDISLPKLPKPKKRPLTELEKSTLKSCFESNVFSDREKAYLYIIYYTGMRRGEALALTIFDFKFSKGTNAVSVTKDLIFDGNNPEIKEIPKTENGNRTIPLPAEACTFLKSYIHSLKGTQLFSCSTNSLITKSAYRKMWDSIISKMNTVAGGTAAFPIIDDLTAHIFRHNFCTNLCYQVPKISIKKIAQLMGDTEKVVLQVYNHIIEEKEDVNEVLKDALVM